MSPESLGSLLGAGHPPISPPCRARRCVAPGLRAHHDRLLAVERDGDELLELFELAVTWGELDYSGHQLIPPEEWLDFAERHDWSDPQRVLRIFSLAADIAARSACGQAQQLLVASGGR